jgi:hypothetical protein
MLVTESADAFHEINFLASGRWHGQLASLGYFKFLKHGMD